MELGKLHMYKFFHDVLKQSLEDINRHYMDTYSFILSYSRGNVDNEHMELSNLDPRSGFPDIPIKTNNKVPGKFKHELGSKIMEEFIVLKPKTFSIKNVAQKRKE